MIGRRAWALLRAVPLNDRLRVFLLVGVDPAHQRRALLLRQDFIGPLLFGSLTVVLAHFQIFPAGTRYGLDLSKKVVMRHVTLCSNRAAPVTPASALY